MAMRDARGLRAGVRRGRPLAEILEARQLLSTITVTSTGDADGADGSDTLSLRQAIEVSNGTLPVASLTPTQQSLVVGALSTPNTINFDIPGTGPFAIKPTTALPAITGPVVINGYSQPGASPNTNGPGQADNAVIEIELINGIPFSFITAVPPGLDLQGGASTVEGLAIGGFSAYSPDAAGILLEGPGGDLIAGDFIGTDATGTRSIGNGYGILDQDAGSDTIGGTTPAARDLLSGNSTTNSIAVYLSGGSNNLVEGNLIGVDPTGTKALANGYGVLIGAGSGNTIGGTASGAGNIISGNGFAGINGGSADPLIEGNFLGTDITGTKAIPNDRGVDYDGGGGITIGGTTAAARNIISGNYERGLNLAGMGMLVEGNYIGVDVTGEVALSNGLVSPYPFAVGDGVDFNGSGTLGGTAAGAGNVISGNAIVGVSIEGAALVVGNLIGVDAAGTKAIPNGTGVIVGSNVNQPGTLGGTTPGAGNVISGNLKDGIDLTPDYTGFYSSRNNLIQGNLIGVDATGSAALPNAGYGVLIEGGPDNTIGGTAAGAGNIIAFNGKAGVGVMSLPSSRYSQFTNTGETISGNSIYGNGGLGIDLGLDGVTPNNPAGDPNGPNRLQPYPVLDSTIVGAFGTLISGTLTAAPTTSYTIEFFSSPSADPSGYGQGKTYLGSTVVDTNSFGLAAFGFTTPSDLGGQAISATATDPQGDTSEFARDIIIPPSTTTTTLIGPSSLATTGQPVTFAAVVATTAGVVPTGFVLFAEGGVVLGQAPLNARGVAVFITDSLAPGPHFIAAVYTGDATDSASLSNYVAFGVLPTIAFGGPTVTSDAITGTNSVNITFSRPLLTSTAQDRANYAIVGPNGQAVAVESAAYDPLDDSVTLTTRQKLVSGHSYQLTVNGVRIGRVDDTYGIPLEGDGRPGTSFVGQVAAGGQVKAQAHPSGPKRVAHARKGH